MNREEIGMMALEAGFMLSTVYGQKSNQPMPVSDSATLERFAKLVAAKERETCAKMCEQLARLWGYEEPTNCTTSGTLAIGCAVAIRARGDA